MARYQVELMHTYRFVEFVEVEMPDNYGYNLATCDELWDKARQLSDPYKQDEEGVTGWLDCIEWDEEPAEICDWLRIEGE